ncbi:S8 family serine peptidase, partial [Microcoleus sp. D2_18a_B4]
MQAVIGVTKVTKASQVGIDIWQIPSGKVEETISAYKNDPRVEYIEPDYIITLDDVQTTSPTQEKLATITPQTTTPNDPGYSQLWGLNNTGQTGGTADADIDASEAWDIQKGNPNTVIGVIDTGVDYNHPDLVGNIWTNPGEIAGDGIDNDNNGYIDDVRGWDFAYNDNDPMDVDGHGTHVSGTIAGKGNNSVGVTGVAWNAKIMPLKFLDDSGYGNTSDAILAINYATAKGVKLTNNSWSGGDYSQALSDAINTAGQQGALFIAAASNDYGQNNDIIPAYPASYNPSNIISVASTTSTDGLSYFSNFGPTSVDLGAPGSEIYSTTPGGNYGLLSGTSMAAPHVTGAAALLWSQNPTWTAQQVKNRLLETTDAISALSGKTVSGGRLNINNALGGSTPPGSSANDNFTNRIVLSGVPVSTTGSNIGATGEVGEPSQSGTTNSVWWSWTAPSSGTFNIDTRSSNFDTYLSVFTGSAVNNLTLIGSNDDGGGNLTSLLSLNATAGTTYQIAVDGFSSNTGQIQLNIVVPPPPNDNFANRIALTGATANGTGSNVGATGEISEPSQSGTTNSAWWSWTAPSSGTFTIDTRSSNFDTYLSVFTGSAVNNLSLIGSNDDGGGNLTSLLSLNATAGTTYQIAVDGFSSNTGQIQLNIAPTGDTIAPTASSFNPVDNATGVAVGANLVLNFSEAIQKGAGNLIIKKVSDNSVVETIPATAANITVSDSQLTINPTADLGQNTEYYVEIANDAIKDLAGNNYAGITGNSTWNFTTTGPSVLNDKFANRIVLSGVPVSTTGSNIGATGEFGEPSQSATTNSVWWSWTAPSSGTFNIDTRSSNFDTYLSVFTGSAVNNLTLIGSNDDGGGNLTSLLSLNATAGTTYQIAVDGFSSNTGQIQLNIVVPPPPNDNFANRISLTGVTANGTGSNVGATGEISEPSQSGTTNSAWWSWTAPRSGTFTIDTNNSNFDTYLSVFSGDAVNNLSLIGSNDDGGGNNTSLLSLNATAGTTYQIAVDGFSSATGSVQLNIAPDIAAADTNGSAGADNLIGTANPETINGLAGNDTLNGAAGNDTLNGNEDNDSLDGGLGLDQLTGGLGNDIYVVDHPGDVVSELPAQGTDLVQSGVPYTLPAEVENLTLTELIAINGTGNTLANIISGSVGSNFLNGLAGNDTLNGAAGDDMLYGNEDNDRLNGGPGADQLTGGLGNDIYVVDNAGDAVTELAGEGIDEVRSTITYTLPAQVENLRLEGTAAIN